MTENEIIDTYIISILKLSPSMPLKQVFTRIRNKEATLGQFILAAYQGDRTLLRSMHSTGEVAIKQLIKDKTNKSTYKLHILNTLSLSICTICNEVKTYTEFYGDSRAVYGITSQCKTCKDALNKTWQTKNPIAYRLCQNNLQAKRRAAKLQRTPKWADKLKISEIYLECPKGYHVDHIVPLQGDLVCGLHVDNNLKPIPAKDNLSKGNKFTVA